MKPKNFRIGRSTRKLHPLVPASSMLVSKPAEARFTERGKRVRVVNAVRENSAKLIRPRINPAGANCRKRLRLNEGWRIHTASSEPKASPSRLNHVLKMAESLGKRPIVQQTTRRAGVPRQMTVSTRTSMEVENLRTSEGQSR